MKYHTCETCPCKTAWERQRVHRIYMELRAAAAHDFEKRLQREARAAGFSVQHDQHQRPQVVNEGRVLMVWQPAV